MMNRKGKSLQLRPNVYDPQRSDIWEVFFVRSRTVAGVVVLGWLLLAWVPLVCGVTIHPPQGGGLGFTQFLDNDPGSTLSTQSLKVYLDGQRILVEQVSNKDGVVVEHAGASLLTSGSVHTVKYEYVTREKPETIQVDEQVFTVPEYVMVPADYNLKPPDSLERGFICHVAQISGLQTGGAFGHEESLVTAEAMLQTGGVDGLGEPFLNEADPAAFDRWSIAKFEVPDVVNWEQQGKTIGIFENDTKFPGIPGWLQSDDGFVIETLGLIKLKRGSYRFGVRTQDGFRFSFCLHPKDQFQLIVAEDDQFSVTARNQEFDFVVLEDGYYPIRLLNFEGGEYSTWHQLTHKESFGEYDNNAELELYSRFGGFPSLLNDVADERGLELFQYYPEEIYISTATVYPGMKSFPDEGVIELNLTIPKGSAMARDLKLRLNGKVVEAEIEIEADQIRIRHAPKAPFKPGSRYHLSLSFRVGDGDRMRMMDLPFQVSEIPARALIVESEDYNYEGGVWKSFEELSLFSGGDRYRGGAYAGVDSKLLVDYSATGGQSKWYRIEEKNVRIIPSPDLDRGTYRMLEDFVVGADTEGAWLNYTRDFPAKERYYKVYARMSSFGRQGLLEYHRVDSDISSLNQATTKLGEFGQMQIPHELTGESLFRHFPLKDAAGRELPLKLGGDHTFRVKTIHGRRVHLNYFMFVEVDKQSYPPYLVEKWPEDQVLMQGGPFRAILKDREQTVVNASMYINGTPVTAEVTQSEGNTHISYIPDPYFTPGQYTIRVNWRDSAGDEDSHEWSVRVPEFYFGNHTVPMEPTGYLNAFEYAIKREQSAKPVVLQFNENFPDSPEVRERVYSLEWLPGRQPISNPTLHTWKNKRDYYGTQLVGYVFPPETGEYTFYIVGNDRCELWLSTDESPANKQMLASEPAWNVSRNYDTPRGRRLVDMESTRYENVSEPIHLEAGKPYFIEVLLVEGGATENVAVTWKLPGWEDPKNGQSPISGTYLAPFLDDSGGGMFLADYRPKPAKFYENWNKSYVIHPSLEHEVTLDFVKGRDRMKSFVLLWNGEDLTASVKQIEDAQYLKLSLPIKLDRYARDAKVEFTWETESGDVGEYSWQYNINSHGYDFNTDFGVENYLVIEAEDFDFGNGRFYPFEQWLPGIYQGVGGSQGRDFYALKTATDNYRNIPGLGLKLEPTSDSVRRSVRHEPDYALYMHPGEWVHYTRDFPSPGKVYDVWCRAAFVLPKNWMNLPLYRVTANDKGEEREILLGYFHGGSTYNINSMKFFPLVDSDQKQLSVYLDGETKLRLRGNQYEVLNYLVFVPRDETISTRLVGYFPEGAVESPERIRAVIQTGLDREPEVKLKLNGVTVPTTVHSQGGMHTIEHKLPDRLPSEIEVRFEWKTEGEEWASRDWEVIPYYPLTSAPDEPLGYLSVMEYDAPESGSQIWWAEGSTHWQFELSVDLLELQPSYPGEPDAVASARWFEWPAPQTITGTSAFDPKMTQRGWVVHGYLHPPETGFYQFSMAADDNAELWISTDEEPANAKLIASESTWRGSRLFPDQGDESISDPVLLKSGSAYYIKGIVKNGSGPGHLAVAWKTPEMESLPTHGALPILGNYLSTAYVVPVRQPGDDDPFDEEPPIITIRREENGEVTLTWTGQLQFAITPAGPWEDVSEESPLTLNTMALKEAQFARTIKR